MPEHFFFWPHHANNTIFKAAFAEPAHCTGTTFSDNQETAVTWSRTNQSQLYSTNFLEDFSKNFKMLAVNFLLQ